MRSLTAAGDPIRVLTFCISPAGGSLRKSIHTSSSLGKAEKGGLSDGAYVAAGAAGI